MHGLFDQDEDENEAGNKYEYLADNQELMSDIVDFTDPTALLRR